MFDIGFSELAVVAIVALLVIGPERLPGVARTVGKWVGAARRFVNNVQAEINAEVSKADELKRLLDEQSEIKSIHEILETKISEEGDRNPVPRDKPDYVVKAMPDEDSEKAETDEQEIEHKKKGTD
jgi:sec-independent protein translocase protein TatB